MALLLVGHSVHERTGAGLFDQARRSHPQAKRALLVPPNVWIDPSRAELIRGAMALGRIDHFLLEPGPPPDEVFHEAISSFLLEWARERRLVPDTVTIVSEDWSGRTYEIRSVLESCAVSHDFCLADSARGRELIAKAGPEARLPLMVLPDGPSDPSNAEMAAVAGAPDSIDVRSARRGRRAGRAVGGRLRRVRRASRAGRRQRRASEARCARAR